MSIIYKNADCPLSLLITLLVFVVMTIFVLIVVVMAHTAVFAWAKATATYNNTPTSTIITPYITIAFVGNISPEAGLDHTSVAGIVTYDATSSRDFEQKLVTLDWGDGTSSHAKITRISSSASPAESKWGPLYHRYDSPTAASHPHAIVASMQIPSYSSVNNGFVQIKSDPYLINVQKGPIKVASVDSQRSSTYVVSKNDGLLINLVSHPVNVIALTILGSVTGCSIYMARHRHTNQNIASTVKAHRDRN
ncbi:MAG TPA: hypothetical protein VH500_13030 [Nitrososphaeraceae archaeon]